MLITDTSAAPAYIGIVRDGPSGNSWKAQSAPSGPLTWDFWADTYPVSPALTCVVANPSSGYRWNDVDCTTQRSAV